MIKWKARQRGELTGKGIVKAGKHLTNNKIGRTGLENKGILARAALRRSRRDPWGPVEFLTAFLGEANPWPLIAIEKDVRGKTVGIHCHAFAAGKAAEMMAWIAFQNTTCHIYFGVNPLKEPLSRKANKNDIREAAWLFADFDPPDHSFDHDAAKLNAWRASIDGSVRPRMPGAPTVVIDSGRGYWCFWKFSEAQPVDAIAYTEDGKLKYKNGPLTDRVEFYGRGVEQAYGSDNIRNIDRIARLPDTVNHRTGLRASVLCWNENAYALDTFPLGNDEPAAEAAEATEASKIKPLVFEELPLDLQNLIRDPDYTKYDGDRSKAVWAAACWLVREGIGNDDGAALLRDPQYRISEHVRDQSNPRQYSNRQMEQARKKGNKSTKIQASSTIAT